MNGPNADFLLALKIANSSSVGGISGVFVIDQSTEEIEQMEPRKKDPKTQ